MKRVIINLISYRALLLNRTMKPPQIRPFDSPHFNPLAAPCRFSTRFRGLYSFACRKNIVKPLHSFRLRYTSSIAFGPHQHKSRLIWPLFEFTELYKLYECIHI